MRPFEGVRVLDLTHVYAGPFAAYQLAVLGAEVIKIEPAAQPDLTRGEGADPELNARGMGLAFQAQAAGKKCLALDLAGSEGQEIFARLVETADVVVLNYTLPAVQRLGLTYERLAELKPDLIYCAISGFGQQGPKAEHPAYDTVIQAFSGIMAANGEAGQDPLRVGPAMVDYGTGAQAALAISAALYGRAVTGQGRYIDVAMADAALMLQNSGTCQALHTGKGPRPHGNRDPSLAGYAAYQTAEGTLMIGAYTNKQMAALMRTVGRPAEAEAIANTPRAEIAARQTWDAEVLADVMLTRTAAEWEELLNAHHVPAARVRHLEESLAEPHYQARGAVQEAEGQRLAVAGFAYGHGSPALDHGPRAHGADSAEVLAGIGITPEAFAALKSRGVVA
ncbi:CoA transferase [Leisingera sp. JC11]|uniref:CaiB/BaiF CoA transferase family protein n=1 Tax=Leisingera sp. JC11 TaxID=3042469 RepID=UPI003451C5AE